MTTRHLVDPELLPLIDTLPELTYSDDAMPDIRAAFLAMEPPPAPLPDGVMADEIMIPGLPGEPSVRALRYRPNAQSRGTLLQLHGGGMIMGRPEQVAANNAALCAQLSITVIAPAYRLAPEHRAPAALQDGLATLLFAARDTDPATLIVSGDSAGGGLAVSVVSAARAHLSAPIGLLHLVYPMLDPATAGAACQASATTGEFVWRRQSNRYGWDAYLNGADPVAVHVPAAIPSLDGFPPTWIGTGALDLFADENLDFAKALIAAGVPVDLTLYAGAVHGFPMVTESRVAQRFARDYVEALARAL